MVEAMVVVMVVAILANVALPSFAGLMARERVRGAADNLRGDLNFARSEAAKRQTRVYVVFSAGSQWCYTVTTDPACGCGGTCASPDSVLKVVSSSEAAQGAVLSASFAGSFCGSQECVRFEPVQGKATGSNGTAHFQGAEGSQYEVRVSALGRVRGCVASGAAAFGWPAC